MKKKPNTYDHVPTWGAALFVCFLIFDGTVMDATSYVGKGHLAAWLMCGVQIGRWVDRWLWVHAEWNERRGFKEEELPDAKVIHIN